MQSLPSELSSTERVKSAIAKSSNALWRCTQCAVWEWGRGTHGKEIVFHQQQTPHFPNAELFLSLSCIHSKGIKFNARVQVDSSLSCICPQSGGVQSQGKRWWHTYHSAVADQTHDCARRHTHTLGQRHCARARSHIFRADNFCNNCPSANGHSVSGGRGDLCAICVLINLVTLWRLPSEKRAGL